MEPEPKRRRIVGSDNPEMAESPGSLKRPISPPLRRATPKAGLDIEPSSPVPPPKTAPSETTCAAPGAVQKSPFQLTHIRDLPDNLNEDAVTLHDLLGDPLISECWDFNYLHDINFLMHHFDEDTRSLVKVHVVHGFWRREDQNLAALKEYAAQYGNVELHAAFMPEMFGTHHSKMLVMFRHDDTAQVVIHTANMIAKDWTNMTNGVWQSPRLPLLPEDHPDRDFVKFEGGAREHATLGSGTRFKLDLLSYLNAYNARRQTTATLVERLARHDFSSIRAVLIASVPGRHHLHDRSRTSWGWPALAEALRHVPVQDGKSQVVAQISSIATLGPTDSWLRNCLFHALGMSKGLSKGKPTFRVVFPTADEIRRSLDGYASGGSIHTKIQSAQQAKQLAYLRPIFCHWANDTAAGKKIPEDAEVHNGGRQLAAPHIKTYIRHGEKSVDWALLTSANISKQAWGEAANASKEVRIASWEVGVLVWPALLTGDEKATMECTFMKDTPAVDESREGAVVGLRVPYSLPLQAYSDTEVPWVATMSHREPDYFGRVYEIDE